MRVMAALEQLPTGGKTPLTHALYKAFEVAARETRAWPTVVLISDGKVNVFINGSLENDIGLLSKMVNSTRLVFVNSEIKHRSIGVLEDLAHAFKAPHFYLEEVL